MFKWYRDAQKCYAYLEDAPQELLGLLNIECGGKVEGLLAKDLASEFRSCKWF